MNASLPPQWLEPSDAYGWAAALRNTLPLLSLLALAPIVADRSILAAWCLTPLIGLFIYRTTVVLHDCTHFTLFKRRRTNKWVGFALGAITGVDFHGFSRLHWRHHRCYGEATDPQGFHYGHLQRMTARQFRWHIVKPLLGVNLRYTAMESALAPKNARRLLRTGGFAMVAAIQLLLLGLVTGWGRHWTLAALPFASAATFGLFFSQLRGIAEHGTVDDRLAPGNVLTHAPHWLDRIVLYDVNFNYHTEHHRYPQVPSCHLRALYEMTAPRELNTRKSMLGTLHALHTGLKRGHAFIAPLCLVVLMSFTHRALAADAGFYVAAGAGKPWEHVDGSGILVGLGFEPPTLVKPTSVDVNDSNVVWNAAVGYRVNRYVAAEVSYLHYGSTNVTETYELQFGGGFPSFDFTRTYSLQIEGPALSVLGRLPVGREFALFARGGIFFADEKVTERGPVGGSSITLGRKVWLASAGAEWSFARSWALRLEYAQSGRIDGEASAGRTDVRHLALNALYSW